MLHNVIPLGLTLHMTEVEACEEEKAVGAAKTFYRK